jgi:hypothetical protein
VDISILGGNQPGQFWFLSSIWPFSVYTILGLYLTHSVKEFQRLSPDLEPSSRKIETKKKKQRVFQGPPGTTPPAIRKGHFGS